MFGVPPGGPLRHRRPSVICITPMSGFVRFCPVLPMLSRFSPSTPCKNRTYSNSNRPSDRTYQTSAPPGASCSERPDVNRPVLARPPRPSPFCILHSAFFYANVPKCPICPIPRDVQILLSFCDATLYKYFTYNNVPRKSVAYQSGCRRKSAGLCPIWCSAINW